MALKIGEPAFSQIGQPGVVIGHDTSKGTLILNTSPEDVKEASRHGYLVGIENRQEFYDLMDKVKEIKDPEEKMHLLKEKIETLEKEASIGAIHVIRYLKSELFHVMNSYHIQPRVYEIPVKNNIL